MGFAKDIARKFIYPVIFKLGADKILSNSYQKKIILMYHGVTRQSYLHLNPRHLIVHDFDRHLKYLKKNYSIISLREIFNMHRQGITPKKRTLAITFDDGFVNNYTDALPILRKHNLPATFFISAASMDNEHYILWSEVMDIIRSCTKGSTITIDGIDFNRQGKYFLYSRDIHQSGADYIKHLSAERREYVLAELKERYNFKELLRNLNPEFYKLINKEQLNHFAASPLVEIGSHAYSHYNLALVDNQTVYQELKISKDKLESVIQQPVISLAYPDGSYNSFVIKTSEALGYKNLVAVNYVQPQDKENKNILPRFGMSNTTTLESNMIRLNREFKRVGF